MNNPLVIGDKLPDIERIELELEYDNVTWWTARLRKRVNNKECLLFKGVQRDGWIECVGIAKVKDVESIRKLLRGVRDEPEYR